MNNPTQTHEDSNIGLTMEDKMILLLEWMGWKRLAPETNPDWWMEPDGNASGRNGMPPLTLDLMAEAEKLLGSSRERFDRWCEYWEQLETVTGCRTFNKDISSDCKDMLHATKEQRLEALLKTIGAA